MHVAAVAGNGGHRALLDLDGRAIGMPPVEHLAFHVGHLLVDVVKRPGVAVSADAPAEA